MGPIRVHSKDTLTGCGTSIGLWRRIGCAQSEEEEEERRGWGRMKRKREEGEHGEGIEQTRLTA